MMLPEMTSSARVARAFLRLARGAGSGLALGALAACGGGGSSKTPTTPTTPSTPSTPTTPEMTITPPAPTMAQLEAAVVIAAGGTATGTLESADDVDFFRLQLAESGTVTFWTTGEAETVVTLLDEEGDGLSAATTSEDRVRVTTALDNVYARVTGREDGRTGNYNLHNEFAAARGAPRIRMPFPSNVLLQTGDDPLRVFEDVLSYFHLSGGGPYSYDARPPAGHAGLEVRVRGGPADPTAIRKEIYLELTPTADLRTGSVPITVTVTQDSTGLTASQVLTVTVVDPNDCVAVRVRRYDEDSCAISNRENGGGWKYAVASYTNSCTERVTTGRHGVTAYWSKWSDDRPTWHPRSVRYVDESIDPSNAPSSGCITGTPPTLMWCAWVDHTDSNPYYNLGSRPARCDHPGDAANFETYTYAPDG